MLTQLAALSAAGLLLGLRHAFEPDHLAAVTTLATRQDRVRDAIRLGAAWGIGHTASVGAVAALAVALGLHLPPSLQPLADLGVAALLLILGAGVLRRHDHARPARDARASLVFGLAHGLAGSGAIVIMVVAAAATTAGQIASLAAFGTGTIAGMLAVSGSMAAAARSARRLPWPAGLHLAAGAVSIAVGALLAIDCLRQL